MSERGPRGRIVYFALVPAVVAAVLVLGFLALRTTLQAERARAQTLLTITGTLAAERVTILDNHIIAQDNVVAAHASLADFGQIGRRWLATAARETPSVRAILVLDMSSRSHDVLAFASRAPSREDDVFRRLLLTRLFRQLNLEAPTDELRHLHEAVDDKQYLVSYWQRSHEGKRYMIVAWHDVDRLVREVMPQLYRDPDRGDARMNVVDEKGRIVFGPPVTAGKVTVGLPFPTTLYNWKLQVSLTSAEEAVQQVERRRYIELSMVVVAGLVTIASLIIMVRASINERRLSALKSDFVANVSHELKTPLSLIRMFGELLLLDRAQNEDKRRQYLSIIVGESERLSALIENVLDFARVERGKATYDFAPGSVVDVARRVVEIYRHRAEREEVELVLEVEGEVPPTDIDARALELAIMNLVDNALKYAKDGGRVTIRVAADDAHVRVRVADRGQGVPRDEQARIFERFYRGIAAEASRARGSGIGLSLVQHIAESHGGEVRVESPVADEGVGSAFEIVLPRGAAVAAPAGGPPAPETGAARQGPQAELAAPAAKGES